MKIVSFIEPTQPDLIQKILTYCGLADEPPRAPPVRLYPILYQNVSENRCSSGPLILA